jgi:hypothetical protein
MQAPELTGNEQRVLKYLKSPGVHSVTAVSIAQLFKWPEALMLVTLNSLHLKKLAYHTVGGRLGLVRWKAIENATTHTPV